MADTNATYPQRVPLRGFERMATTTDGVSMKIVHSMLVVGDVDTLLRFLPTALLRTFNMHPRMRALQFKGENFTAQVQAPITMDTIRKSNLLRVRRFSYDQNDGTVFTSWEKYAASECDIGFDRYTQFPFFLTVWVDGTSEKARLMLFSDHYMSDGYSGMVVLNCILEQVVILINAGDETPDNAVQEFKLRPSVYQMWLSKMAWLKPLMKAVISLFGKAIYRSEMKKFHPVLPARSDQQDFVVPPISNPTSASFAQGDPLCMRMALARCAEEKVTFGGALVSAIVLSFYHAAKAQPNFDPPQPFMLSADLDYNMRRRVPQPAEEDQVGMYVAFSELGWLKSSGVNMETTKFWDLARQAKQVIDDNLRHTLEMSATTFVLDRRIHAKMDPSFVKAINIRHSQTSDANISNVGQYPYTRQHVFASQDNDSMLTVKSLHVYNPIPHLGPSATFFISSVESFSYSMGHKCEDSAAKLLFKAWVAICENVGAIGSDDTLSNVLLRLKL